MDRFFAVIGSVAIAVGLPVFSGCTQSLPDVSVQPSADAEIVRQMEPRETWDVYLLQGKRIGYGKTTVQSNVDEGQDVVVTTGLNHLAVKRAGQTTEEDILTTSVETPQGQMLRFRSEIRMGQKPIHTVGRVRGNRLDIEVSGAEAAPMRTSLAWPPNCRGPYALEQSLMQKPMQPGERRTMKSFVVGFNQVADIELTAKDYAPTKLLHGAYDLLQIKTLTRLADGQKIEGAVWADRTGDTLKTYSQAMGLETFRASKVEALEKADVVELDLLPGTLVKVERPLLRAHQTQRVRYRVHLKGGDPASVFVTGPMQAVKSVDPQTAEITVYAIRPGQPEGNSHAPADPPSEDDLGPNSFIQSDDPLIVADAKKAVGPETDPWKIAAALERYVHEELKKKNFSQAFATASEVARSLEGDCTEHAVFLAALCRARGIPARVAIGLVYIQGDQAFGYHMWTEAYIDKRWIPLDGTLARGGIGAGHLKIQHTNLKGASAYSAFLPVVQVLGRLSIEVLDVQE